MHSNHRKLLLLLLVAGLFLLPACTPRIIVRANPGRNDTGIRYYRPKPYLKIEPAEVTVGKSQTEFAPGLVRISLAYLPDFSEEYSIDVRSGFGTADVGITLEDGWNLTEINQDLDSQTDENLKAIGSILSAVGDIVPTSSNNPPKTSDLAFTVPARNVPIGFYESVIGRDDRGCKRLYGFRYVGFLPYGNCPIDIGGQEHACCGDLENPLFGLTFVDGQMVFQALSVMAHASVQRQSADLGPELSSRNQALRSNTAEQMPTPRTQMERIDIEQLPILLRAHLRELGHDVREVRVSKGGQQVTVQLDGPSGVTNFSLRQAIDEWLERSVGSSQSIDVRIE